MNCCVCESEVDVKYRCPGCDRRTCRLECVKKHKEQFGCSGLKGKVIPCVPESGVPGEKYSEELFVKDYGFLESINDQISKLESENPGKKNEPRDKLATEKLAHFKKIQKVAKLAELRMLPTGFSRSKVNRTHFIERDSGEETTTSEAPERKSSRMARIAWTLDFVDYDSCKLLETVFDIPDDTKLEILLAETLRKPVQAVYLRNETRNGKEATEKWRAIGKEEWRKTVAQILTGGRCFEYPQFGICFDSEDVGSDE